MVQYVLKEKKVEIEFLDISSYNIHKKKNVERKILENDLNNTFDLQKETFRLYLFKVQEKKYHFSCTYHHIILDAWSVRIIEKKFCEYYLNYLSSKITEEKNKNYAEYIEWIKEQDIDLAIKYWKEYFKNISYTNLNAKSIETTYSKKYITMRLCSKYVRLIKNIAEQYNSTENMVFMLIWAIYLAYKFNRNKFVFACVVMGRLIPLRNIEELTGLFVNANPIIMNTRNSIMELLNNFRRSIFMSSKYMYISLSEILECGNLKVNDLLGCINFSIDSESINNIYSKELPFKIHSIKYKEQANYDIFADVFKREDKIECKINYNSEIYDFTKQDFDKEIKTIISLMSREGNVEEIIKLLKKEYEDTIYKGFEFDL